MEILSVKIENLASIASAEIDFNGGILKNHPVFAITGKTGVGKSTILDAICLGIYGKTPRYDKIGGVDLEDKLKGNSPSNILRRGCGKGSATVNFYGIGRVEYQAVWKVQRARANAAGAMQMPDHELYEILANGERKSIAQKSLVKEKIIEVTGLSFEQFRHAVLLPQGEFRAFLEAKSDERATLLEKLTGTEIYGEISKVAHKRNSDKESNIRALRAQIDNISILSDIELAELQKNIQTVEQEISALNQRKSNLEAAENWYLQNEKQRFELQNKESELSAILSEIQENSANAAELAGFDHAYANIYPSWQELKRVQAESIQQTDRLTRLSAENKSLENELAAAFQIQAEKTVILAEKEQLEKEQQPQIILARELDTKISALQKNQFAHMETVTVTRQNLNRLNNELASINAKSSEIELQKFSLQNQLAELNCFQPVFEQKELIIGNLSTLDKYRQSVKTKQIELHKISTEKATAEQELAELQNLFENSSARQQELNNQIATLESELSQFDIEQLNQQIVFTERKILELKNALALKQDLVKEEDQLAQNQKLLATVEQEFELIRIQTEAQEKAVLELQNSLEQHKENYNSAALATAKTANDLRALLRSNEPCPVCGSKEHPYQHDLPHFNTFLQTLQEQINTAESNLKAQTLQLKKRQTDFANNNNKLTVLKTNIANSEEKIAALSLQLGDFLQVTNPEEQLVNFSTELQSAQKHQQTALKIQQQLSQIRQTVQKAASNFTDLQQKISASSYKISIWNTDCQIIAKEIFNAEEEATTLTESLTAKLSSVSDLQNLWVDEPLKAITYINEKHQLFASINTEIATRQESLQELAERKSNISGQLLPINEQLVICENSLSEINQKLTALQHERKTVLDGKNADQMAAELQSAVTKARAEKESAMQKHQDLTRLKSKSDTEISLLYNQLAKSRQEMEIAASAINQYLSTEKQSIEQLEQLFSQPAGYYEKIRTQLKALHDRRENINGAVSAIQKSIGDHQKNQLEILFAECSQLPLIAANLSEQSKTTTALQAQLLNDTNQRAGLSNQLAKIAEAEAEIQIWREINEAIGSADGKKFREYAQGINLLILLANANLFLQQLRDRYELQRHRNSMEIVLIDRDLCNAVRPVNSLSGGESFLVSMALALGLSSMASGKIAINSLFIDEGFGTLDEETLSVVLEVLQSLHQMGKQVGIISHVPDIASQIGAEIHLERVAGVAKLEIRN